MDKLNLKENMMQNIHSKKDSANVWKHTMHDFRCAQILYKIMQML